MSTTHRIVVLAKYPAGHHRDKLNPNWHAYADNKLDPSDPELNDKVTMLRTIALMSGAKVRIGRLEANQSISKAAGDE